MYQLTKGTKMTIKQKAIIQTIAILTGIVLGSVILNLILMYSSAQMILYVLGIAMIGLFVYATYGVVLARLEYNQKLEDVNSKT